MRRILGGFGEAQTLKSAAPLSVPRRVRPICFNIQDLIDLSTYRGGPGNPHTPIFVFFGPFFGTMLASFFALGRFLGAFGASRCVFWNSGPVFVGLRPLLGRFWRVSGKSGKGFGSPRASFFEFYHAS